MPIEVPLIEATELEQMVAFQQIQIVAEHVILAVPKARADVLRVHVVGNQGVTTASSRGDFSANFYCATEAGNWLRRSSCIAPLPPVIGIAVMEVVGQIVANRSVEPEDHDRRIRRQVPRRSVLTLGSPQDSTHIGLTKIGLAQFVVAIAAHEVPVLREVMI